MVVWYQPVYGPKASPSPLEVDEPPDFPGSSLYRLGPGISNATDGLTSYVPPSVITLSRWYRNINLLSIGYASRPRLRDRLTLSGLTFLRKP